MQDDRIEPRRTGAGHAGARRRLAWTLAVALGSALISPLAGCGGDGGPQTLEVPKVAISTLGTMPAGTLVVRSSADWVTLWQTHQNPNPLAPAAVVPAVDFSRYAVAAVFAGPKPRCRALDITAGTIDGGVASLRYRINTFGQGTPSSCIGNDPFTANLSDAVLIPAEATEVQFIDETGSP